MHDARCIDAGKLHHGKHDNETGYRTWIHLGSRSLAGSITHKQPPAESVSTMNMADGVAVDLPQPGQTLQQSFQQFKKKRKEKARIHSYSASFTMPQHRHKANAAMCRRSSSGILSSLSHPPILIGKPICVQCLCTKRAVFWVGGEALATLSFICHSDIFVLLRSAICPEVP